MRSSVLVVVGPILALQWALRVGVHPDFALLARLLCVAVRGSTAPTLLALGASQLAKHAVLLIATPRSQPRDANRRAASSDSEYVIVSSKNGDHVMRNGCWLGAFLCNERYLASVLRGRVA